jgi:hypothetical protein
VTTVVRGTAGYLIALSALVAIGALAAWGFLEGREEAHEEEIAERPVEMPLRITSAEGVPAIRLSDRDIRAAEILIVTIADAVPDDAVVWSDGKPWVFVEVAPLRFRKVPLVLEKGAAGDRAARGVPPGSRVVVQGAQLLLSEEMRDSIEVGEENE